MDLSGSYSKTILEDLYKLTKQRLYYETNYMRIEDPENNIGETALVVKTIPKMIFYDFVGKMTLMPSRFDVLTFLRFCARFITGAARFGWRSCGKPDREFCCTDRSNL